MVKTDAQATLAAQENLYAGALRKRRFEDLRNAFLEKELNNQALSVNGFNQRETRVLASAGAVDDSDSGKLQLGSLTGEIPTANQNLRLEERRAAAELKKEKKKDEKERREKKQKISAVSPLSSKRRGLDRLLRISWYNIIDSCGTTLLWINVHAFLHQHFPKIFCALGEEWSTMAPGSRTKVPTAAKMFEKYAVYAVDGIIFLLILISFFWFVFIVVVNLAFLGIIYEAWSVITNFLGL